MTELKHYKSDTNPQIIVETLKADGALILDNVVSTILSVHCAAKRTPI